uniref:Uncharacterized protein n=1 Tax=Arundo donax TaxID=35708 RepID=A0A0A9FST1_ARUDO
MQCRVPGARKWQCRVPEARIDIIFVIFQILILFL